MNTKELNYTVSFNADPEEVYETLMDPVKHAAFTEAPADISQDVGGKFSLHGGYIFGTNTELVKGKKIVQSWRTEGWEPQDHYSTVTYLLEPDGDSTKLTFSHTNIPGVNFDSISEGWYSHYWDPMKKLFSK
ncbi:MAG: SRPBCC family protein [Ignavibacteria bacterium]